MRLLSALAVAVALACAANAAAPRPAAPQIAVLSNRADLISGGDALVEIKWPAGVRITGAKVTLNGAGVTAAFGQRPNARYMGLVTGLKDGDNVLAASVGNVGSRLTISSHPIGGPVFSGAQLHPWVCATPVAAPVTVAGPAASTPQLAPSTTKVSGLGSDPLDEQCNATPVYTYYYRKATARPTCAFGVAGENACYTEYDAAARPADADIASFTNDRGVVVKDLIRIERGAINRGIYSLVTMFDPRDANAPWMPPKGWNGKLVWLFGASASHSRFQTGPVRSLFEASGGLALRRGFMVATSSLTDHGTNSNDVLGAETLMMVKELIAEKYGEIRYTIGDGCSGGSIKQLAIASAYPGLLDGLQPQCTYADALTPFIEIADCGDLQANYYANNPHGQALTAAQRSAINGHENAGFCAVWIRSFLPAMDPTRAQNCGFPANYPLVFNPRDNRGGIRCTAVDHLASVLGTFTGTDGIARAPTIVDNVGVQYGLKALRDGVISPEEFVRLNEGAGGYDNDLVWHQQRSSARADALAVHYRSGLVSDGRQLAKVPIIDMRGNQAGVGDIHANWRPYSVRDRLDRDAGSHENQVIWKFNSTGGAAPPGPALLRKAFTTMDAWLSAIEADHRPDPIETKVRRNRPAEAEDFCIATTGATEADLAATFGIEYAACPVKQQSSPRQVAGGPRAENIYKCRLKRLDLSDGAYGDVRFSDDQKDRLRAVFPDGVCDWSLPGVGQAPANPWTTFAAGPDGRPLGSAPASVPIR